MTILPVACPPMDPAALLAERFIEDANKTLLGAGLLNDTPACSAAMRAAAIAVIDAAAARDPTARMAAIHQLMGIELQGRKAG